MVKISVEWAIRGAVQSVDAAIRRLSFCTLSHYLIGPEIMTETHTAPRTCSPQSTQGTITPLSRLSAEESARLLADFDVGPKDGEGQLVVAAMSGGVDSAVTALLLRERGYRVVGVNMRLYTPPEGEEYPNPCCAPEALEDARIASQRIGIPFYPINLEEEFQRNVIDYFVDEYARGRTPNPCLECNRHVKFKHLIAKAQMLGADFLATGHYARIERDDDGHCRLFAAVDETKDQSYVLHTMSQEQLRYLQLPLGRLHKSEVREIARRFGLNVAGKPDSQETCFVGRGAYADFVLQRRPGVNTPGEIVTLDDEIIGEHQGLLPYTVGQRKGIGVAYSEPLYVLRLDTRRNRLVVGTRDQMQFVELGAKNVTFTSSRWPEEPFRCEASVRYQGTRYQALVEPHERGQVTVTFEQSPNAVAPGQAVVFYDGAEVLGGGTIDSSQTALELRAQAS